ncbi:MAG TPA: caspase family protein [Propylenella sp.]
MRAAAIALAALIGGVAAAVSPSGAATRALVVGIDKYPDIKVSGVGNLRNLRGAVSDARSMREALSADFDVGADEIRLLTDEAATRSAILSEFRSWLIDGTQPGDRAIFYFAGHGAQVEDESGDEVDDRFDEVLVPHDTVGELEGPEAGMTGFIADDEVDSLLTALAGREVLIIVDACHSGTITRGALDIRADAVTDIAGQGIPEQDGYSGVRTLTPNGPLAVSQPLDDLGARAAHRVGTRLIQVVGTSPEPAAGDGPKLAVWTAAASAQLAMEDMEVGGSQGLFTSRFVKGLAVQAADLNGNGKVTASELLAYLRNESDRYCETYRCGPGGLTPTLEAWTGYDTEVLTEKPGAADEATYGESIASDDALPEYGASGGVTVALSGDGYSRLGEPLRIKVESERGGELIVLDVRDDGTTVQLFPNTPSLSVGAQTVIGAGEARFLPGDEDPFELVPDSAGSGRIVALVVDPRAPVAPITSKYLDLAPIPSPEAYVAEIGRALNHALDYPTGSEAALERPAAALGLARGEARYTIE